MVDFQSRDTRRGPTSDEDEDENEDASETPPTESDEAIDSDAVTEPTSQTDSGAADENESDQSPIERDDAPAAETAAEPTSETDTEPTDESDSSPTERDEVTDPNGVSETDAGAADTATSTDSDRAADTPANESLTEQTADSRADHAQPAHSAANDQPTATESAGSMPTQPLDVAVVTVDTIETASVEDAVTDAFESAGHTITTRERLATEYDTLQHAVETLIDRDGIDVVVTAGGIGLGTDEVTIEAVHPLFEKALPGFGEAFRTLLFEHIGTGIVAVRSTAGIANGTLVFCLPGGHEAAALAVDEIIATEAPELVAHLD